MFFFNLTLAQFLTMAAGVSAIVVVLYLLDRSRSRHVVSTLRFWTAAEQPIVASRRKHIRQPVSLLLQIVSLALLLLAIAQLRWGTRAAAGRDHVLILETSAWMGAKSAASSPGTSATLMDDARERARAYLRALPEPDRVMLVRADGLVTPATAFEADRIKLQQAVAASQAGSTALNLDQAFGFAGQILRANPGHAGEIVFIGAGRTSERESQNYSKIPAGALRVLPITDSAENCGLRKIGFRRSASDPDVWEVLVTARNYGIRAKTVTLVLSFGVSPEGKGGSTVGSRQLLLPAATEREVNLEFRTKVAGLLEARLLTQDVFAADDHTIIELPQQRILRTTVYSNEPESLRPLLASSSQIRAEFRKTSEYTPASGPDLVILDRFRPPERPTTDSIWIDPPPNGSPVRIRSRLANAQLTTWHSENALGAGLRTRDLRLESTSVFDSAPTDLRIGEVAQGPVVVARPGTPKTVVLGFHPVHSAMQYHLALPLLFANVLRWMAPDVFRRSEWTGGSVGMVTLSLDREMPSSEIRVLSDAGASLPFTLRGRTIHFFSGAPGTVRVLAADREYVYSLTLPEMWESKWESPADVKHGIPSFRDGSRGSKELWPWLAILGGIGLLLEWILFGSLRKGPERLERMPLPIRRGVRKAS